MVNFCTFSADRKYRYTLKHTWRDGLLMVMPEKSCVWIGLNPSTADESKLDPTLGKIKGFSTRFGYNTFIMLNLFAFRATDPKVMIKADDPVGPDNDINIIEACAKVDLVVCAWGGCGGHLNRDKQVLEMLEPFRNKLHCIGRTLAGFPRHPLYISYKVPLQKI